MVELEALEALEGQETLEALEGQEALDVLETLHSLELRENTKTQAGCKRPSVVGESKTKIAT